MRAVARIVLLLLELFLPAGRIVIIARIIGLAPQLGRRFPYRNAAAGLIVAIAFIRPDRAGRCFFCSTHPFHHGVFP
ncbi:MAG: hypothetical protein LBT71_03990 [Azoarcus sp.]|nr:hypothetical protein [Azoarcus sp.]